jgi:signal transduction histidine kinase
VQRLQETGQPLSWTLRLYWVIELFSTRFIILGFVAMFWHFAWWLGVLFVVAAWAAYRIFRSAALEDFKQHPEQYE